MRVRAGPLLSMMLGVSAAAGSDRFAPDIPWYEDFEQACRIGFGMDTSCRPGVLEGARLALGAEDIVCDWEAFWKDSDRISSDLFRVLPCQSGVAFVIAEPGICAPAAR